MICSFCERTTGFFRDDGHHLGRELGMAIETGAHGCAAEGHFAERLLCPFHPLDGELDLTRIAAELLSQPHRGCILQMRAYDFDDPVELFGFSIEGFAQACECWEELVMHQFRCRNVN